MFTSDLILLLVVAASPTPGASSLHPMAAGTGAGTMDGTVLALSGDWRDNPAPAPAPPPPPPPMERVRPRRGWVWVEGGYDWTGHGYVRLRGHWEKARSGRQWHGGHWEWKGDRYGWVSGAWSEGPAYDAPPPMVVDNPAPPPPPPEVVAPPPAQPRPGFVWIAGAQEWRDGRYVWIEGHWEQERRGDAWRPGHWDSDRDRDRHAWHPGGWEHGDHDRGDPRDRDRDRGDWRGQEHGHEPRGGVSIAGQIVDQTGRPVAGIRVVLAGSSEGQVVSDGDGRYAFTGLAPGSYAVRPNEPRCGFRPDVMNLNNLDWNAVQNFSASCR